MRRRGSGKVVLSPTQFIVSLQSLTSVIEGAASTTKTVTIGVSRAGNIGYGGSVDWSVTATGSNPSTTADFGGSFPNGTITFGNYDMSANIELTLYGNNVVEGDRTFMITLSNVSTSGGSGEAMISIPTMICTIIDDDAAGGGEARYEGNDALYIGSTARYGFT